MLDFGFSVSTIIFVIAVLISASATYNAYMLRGGKLASSQIMMALGMISFMLSVAMTRFSPSIEIVGSLTATDVLFILGFVLLFLASLKLRSSFK